MNVLVVWSSILFFLFVFLFVGGLYLLIVDVCWIVEYNLGKLICSDLDFVVVFDWVSVLFMSLVLLISCCVLFYSVEYMKGDLYLFRFCFLVLLFVFSMGMVIFSSNLVSILIGWDGLGLVSYALVIYYYNVRSLNAGVITVLSNRIGDIGLLMAIVWMFGFGNWNFIIYVDCFDYNVGWVGLFVLLAGMTSSAQFPFSSWLPAAMAAPTPVSALVHSSTLVTAGVYLLIRFWVLFNFNWFGWFLISIGVITMFMAGYCSLWEMDMSSVVALSTLSQLGFMMVILGCGCWWMAYFHLLTHALFKSLLFLCVGYMIHGYLGEQDFRGFGGLVGSPIVMSGMNLSLLALMGFPFLAGFYSSDMIIEMVFGGVCGSIVVIMIGFGLGMTVLFSFRIGFFGIWGEGFYNVGVDIVSGSAMEFSIVVLSLFSIFFGSFLGWFLFGVPVVVWVDLYIKVLGLFFIVFGFFLSWLFFFVNFWCYFYWCFVDFFGGLMWFLVGLSGNNISRVVDEFYSDYEVGWSEVVGVYSISGMIKLVVPFFELLSNNVLNLYMLSMLVWFVFIYCLV
uniref:NADH-ubiquinone oxidoreductase chain 5 n=1 Tax=Pseudocellus gertschi TaxID=1329481 RepID=W5R4I5_9ARAC|nr:NADH dehydrogenase subunit 5 [Pseudocellus gertschi]AGL11939.1 NADH dehydrogenase subunit 5 [Pseudocellus gertschi]